MPTTPNELAGIGLAVAVAERLFGWKTRPWEHFDYHTDTVHPTLQVYRNDGLKWDDWEPWRDPRAWWEIVEKVRDMGYAFGLHNQDNNDIWDAAFVDEHGGVHGYAQAPGEAIMRAALAAVEVNA